MSNIIVIRKQTANPARRKIIIETKKLKRILETKIEK